MYSVYCIFSLAKTKIDSSQIWECDDDEEEHDNINYLGVTSESADCGHAH